MVREVKITDAEDISLIYNYYIENTVITFEETKISIDEMAKRIKEYTASYPWLVYEEDNKVIGYAYVSAWKARASYRYSGETTVYVQENRHSKGIGTALYTQLLKDIEKYGLHTLIAGITLPNEKSVKLHEKAGFTKAAHFREVGNKFGTWLDVGYWQIQL